MVPRLSTIYTISVCTRTQNILTLSTFWVLVHTEIEYIILNIGTVPILIEYDIIILVCSCTQNVLKVSILKMLSKGYSLWVHFEYLCCCANWNWEYHMIIFLTHVVSFTFTVTAADPASCFQLAISCNRKKNPLNLLNADRNPDQHQNRTVYC